MAARYIDFAYVKEAASFEHVIAAYNLKLLGTGPQRSLLCPFHRERKPSCKIDLERNIWHCFGCEAKGNILEFVARLEGDEENLRDAAVKIAEICGIALAPPRGKPATRAGKAVGGRRPRRAGSAWADENHAAASRATNSARVRVPAAARPETVTQLPARARLTNRHFHGVADQEDGARLTHGQIDGVAEVVNPPLAFQLKLDPTHPYLAARGLSAAAVAEFGLGYCSRGSMAGRVCIPIHNATGELVAYAGRWPSDDDIPEDADRYKLPPKFQKRAVLFNLHRVGDVEHIVLVEGYWSAFRLHLLGVPVAALMGWSVSPEQIALLRDRGTQLVTLLLDGDDAGRRGRERVLPDLASSFFVRAPLLPDGQKPDTLPERALRELVGFAFP